MILQRPVPGRALALSDLSLGCAQLGNLYRVVPDADARAAVDAAWDLGVRYFDTAPHYGLGLSERRLGSALASRPRDAYVLSSKVGRLLEPVDESRGGTTGLCGPGYPPAGLGLQPQRDPPFPQGSLERLGLDRLDIVYLHDPDDHWSDVLASGYRRSTSCAPRAWSAPSAPG